MHIILLESVVLTQQNTHNPSKHNYLWNRFKWGIAVSTEMNTKLSQAHERQEQQFDACSLSGQKLQDCGSRQHVCLESNVFVEIRQTGAEPPHEILTGHSCSNMKKQSVSEKPLRRPYFLLGLKILFELSTQMLQQPFHQAFFTKF